MVLLHMLAERNTRTLCKLFFDRYCSSGHQIVVKLYSMSFMYAYKSVLYALNYTSIYPQCVHRNYASIRIRICIIL